MSSRTTLAGCLIGALVFASGFTAGRTVEDGPAIKSAHLLNLPSSVSEADGFNEPSRAATSRSFIHAGR